MTDRRHAKFSFQLISANTDMKDLWDDDTRNIDSIAIVPNFQARSENLKNVHNSNNPTIFNNRVKSIINQLIKKQFCTLRFKLT